MAGDPLRKVDEAAEQLGCKPKTIRQWLWRRQLPHVKVGRLVRIRQSAIDELLARGTVPATRERAS